MSDIIADLAELAKKKTAASALASRPFVTWKLNDFLSYEQPADQLLLGEGYIQRGQWTSVIGVGGLGKTRAVLWLCICFILEQEWLGLPTHCPGCKILFLSTENGATRWKNDLQKMTRGMTPEQLDRIHTQMDILSLDAGGEDDADPSLNMGDAVAQGRLAATLKHLNPDLIVFDPLADMVDGDENSAESMGNTLRTVRGIQRRAAPRAAGLLIHHARTGAGNVIQAGDNFNAGNFGRGSKTLYSAVRCEIQMAPGDKEDNTRLVVCCGKSNDAPKFPSMGVIFDPVSFRYAKDETWNEADWRAAVQGQASGMSLGEMLTAIRPLFSGMGCEVTLAAMCDALSAFAPSDTSLKRRIREAITAGYIRRGDRGFYGLGIKPFPAYPAKGGHP